MPSFPIEGDLSAYSSQQIQVICDTLEKLNFKGKHAKIKHLGKAGDNFASDVKVIEIKGDDKEPFKIIVKLSPNHASENAMKFMTSIFFNNEITMYTEILPLMMQLQEDAGIPIEEKYIFPSCYGVSRVQDNEVILLEDISKLGYGMLDKFIPLEDEPVKLTLQSLARFHALSYAIKDKLPDKFTEFSKRLVDMNSLEEMTKYQNFDEMADNFSEMFDKLKYKQMMKEIMRNQGTSLLKIVQSDSGSKYSVFAHGDTWTNNILFKLTDGVPTESMLIDYQISKDSLPVADVLYLIFNCTDYETRKKHFHDWMDFYHLQLEKSLFNYGLKINQVYPRDKFDSDLKRYAKPYIGIAVMVLNVLLRGSAEAEVVRDAMKDTKDMDTLAEFFKVSNLQQDTVSNMKKRLEGLIDSCLDFGYLKYSIS